MRWSTITLIESPTTWLLMVMMGIGSVLSMTSMGNTSTSDHNPPTSLTCKLTLYSPTF